MPKHFSLGAIVVGVCLGSRVMAKDQKAEAKDKVPAKIQDEDSFRGDTREKSSRREKSSSQKDTLGGNSNGADIQCTEKRWKNPHQTKMKILILIMMMDKMKPVVNTTMKVWLTFLNMH